MIAIQDLYIYPIKSLGGIRLEESRLTDRGLQHDRRWMLVDDNNRFLSQRELHTMALLQTALEAEGIRVYWKTDPAQSQLIPFEHQARETLTVQIWGDTCPAMAVSDAADRWFSKVLGSTCRLVYMPHDTHRLVDPMYAHNREITSFSDGYPLLAVFQESLDNLNNRLAEKIPMDRFRPNIVLAGGQAYDEDRLGEFRVGGLTFRGVKPCARCVVTTINQENAVSAAEPLRTLSRYRQKNNKVIFGQNVLCSGEGLIRTGDQVDIVSWHPPLFTEKPTTP